MYVDYEYTLTMNIVRVYDDYEYRTNIRFIEDLAERLNYSSYRVHSSPNMLIRVWTSTCHVC